MRRDEEAVLYALRISPRAERDIALGFDWFQSQAGEEIAREWRQGLFDEFSTLATHPRRYPIPANTAFRSEVRRLVYRRQGSSVAYLLLYRVADDTLDGPCVNLLHVRHGAARPITRKEARGIES